MTKETTREHQGQPDFIVHLVLENIDPSTIVEDMFGTGLAKIGWFEKIEQGRGECGGGKKEYLASLERSRKVLEYAREHARVTASGNLWELTFPIRHQPQFDEDIREDGARPWLRQFFDDTVYWYVVPSMLEASFDWKNEKTPEETSRLGKHHDAVKTALRQAYLLESPTFWIENERSLVPFQNTSPCCP